MSSRQSTVPAHSFRRKPRGEEPFLVNSDDGSESGAKRDGFQNDDSEGGRSERLELPGSASERGKAAPFENTVGGVSVPRRHTGTPRREQKGGEVEASVRQWKKNGPDYLAGIWKKRKTSVKNISKKKSQKLFLVTESNGMLWKKVAVKPVLLSNTLKRKHMWSLRLKMVLISST